MFKLLKTRQGFTLIELIVYIAIASMVLITAVSVGWNLILSEAKVVGKQEVYMNTRLVMHKIQAATREAEDIIVGSSSFGVNPGKLTFDYPGAGTDVVIDTYQKIVTIGGQATTINKLRIKEGAAAEVDLTSDKLDVTNFTVANLTRGSEKKNIGLNITIEKVNNGPNINFDAEIEIETSLSLRQ